MDNQLEFEEQLHHALVAFEKRVKRTGWIVWQKLLKRKLGQIADARKAKDDVIYGELMQIESLAQECEPSEASAQLLNKIYKLKGLVGTLCLSLVCFGMLQFSFVGVRPARNRNSGTVTIQRTIRKKEELAS